ncbi:MAG: hypothetical protein K6C35_04115 [Eubacterium sp.]|nr:hypothetical protein [Eubacterium sp.]
MQTSVELQEPISYMPLWIILAIVLLLLIIASQIVFRILFKGRLKKPKKVKIKKPRPKTMEEIKKKYLFMLNSIESNLAGGKITVREGYKRISECIRGFVFEATGVPVDKFSLSEIRKMRMPVLTSLVQEYYEPEFARTTYADIRQSAFKTRKAIETWR